MTVSDVCIRRPVFTWVLVAVPVVLGLTAYFELGVDIYPKIDFPVVGVTASQAGASAEEIESSLAKPLEEAINSVSGLDELTTTVREGTVTLVAQFLLEKNGDVAAQEVRDKVSSILRQLPDGVEPPVVDKFNTDALPVLTIGLSGNRDLREVTEIARRQIQEPLQTVSGVGAVFLSGGRQRAVNVLINPDRLTSYNLSVEDVRRSILAQNLELPGGLLHQGPRELVLRTLGRVSAADQFNDLIIENRNGYPVRIRDVARAEDGVEEPRGLSRLNGVPAVSLFVQKQSGTNTITVVDGVLRRLKRLEQALPGDVTVEIIQDQSRFVRQSMEEVKFHLLLAAVLVSLTILLFIRDWRTTVIATLAIPTSIMPTFLFMYLMGFTLNNVTMLALILAIGVVIDDAVVVHENIFRHMEEGGLDALTAAHRGTREIALAVLATSLSLVVIFLPVAFMGGIAGRFFSSFGSTVAFAVMMSLFVSFTLTPMLCSRFLKLEPGHPSHGSKSGRVYRVVDRFFAAVLGWSLRHRLVVVLLSLVAVAATVPLAAVLGANLIPRDDQSEFQVTVITPEGYTLERTDQAFRDMEEELKPLPGVTQRFAVIGENTHRAGKGQGDVTRGSIVLRLRDLGTRAYSQFDVMARARRVLTKYPDLRLAVSDVSSFEGAGKDNRIFRLNLLGPDLNRLSGYADTLLTKLRAVDGLTDVDSTLSLRKPEVQVGIDRERAADLGIQVQTIGSTIKVMIGGQPVSRYKEGLEQYDVWLRAAPEFRANPQSLASLTLPAGKKTAGLVQLGSLARAVEAVGPSQIDRLNRQRTVTILGNPERISLNEAVQAAKKAVAEMNLPPPYEAVFLGQAKTLDESAYYFTVALGLSILFMYLILAAQFESWVAPFCILASLPVTIPFGFLSLLLFRSPIDLYSMFGLFMLIGIVKKNGILQIDKAIELRRTGVPRDQALKEANRIRLRPILMTTVMLIAAMAPIALGQGPGAGARASMAKIIIGGQTLSLVLALVVTPVTYSLLAGRGTDPVAR